MTTILLEHAAIRLAERATAAYGHLMHNGRSRSLVPDSTMHERNKLRAS